MIPWLLAVMAVTLAMPSCSKEKAQITVHYSMSNSSGFDLRLQSSGMSAFDLPDGATKDFTDVTEGVDYNGSCSFATVFNEGASITVSYEGEEYRYDAWKGYRRYFLDAINYNVHKDAPREYTLRYNFESYEIMEYLQFLGVQVDGLLYGE